MIKIAFNIKSQGTKKLKLSSQGICYLKDDTLVIADYECVNIFSLAMLHVKLWLNEDNVLHKFHAFE